MIWNYNTLKYKTVSDFFGYTFKICMTKKITIVVQIC